jgi:cytochrome c peroxidase
MRSLIRRSKRVFLISAAIAMTVGFLTEIFSERRPPAIKQTVTVHSDCESLEHSSQQIIGVIPAAPELNQDKIKLGMELFRDPRLSKTDQVSCASCHDLAKGGADHRQFSLGINGQIGSSNAPTVFNSSLNFRQFWDGRAENLESQLQGPIHNPIEMGTTWNEIIAKLSKDARYNEEFNKVYRSEMTEMSIVDAIVSFEQSLTTPNAPFDRYELGDPKALSSIQVLGYEKFKSYGCIACHQGVGVGGNMYQTLGVMGDYFKDRGGSFPSDMGRFNITGLESDRHVFRVPSLRNVQLTAPYFHDGTVQTLNQAVHLMAKYQLGRDLSEEDTKAIVEFLNSLTGDSPAILNSKEEVARAN